MKKTTLLLFILTALPVCAQSLVDEISVMTLNVYGWKTMPQHSNDYAKLVKDNRIEVLGIQEGVEDWQLTSKLPTDYRRATALNKSLGECWAHKFQIFINICAGVSFVESGRFDLTDGPNATRTGEYAVIEKSDKRYLFVNVHWDHESVDTRIANALETSKQLNKFTQYPKILLGDFNSQCDSKETSLLKSIADMTLLNHGGIDCLFGNGVTGATKKIEAHPSDHPSIIATLVITN